MITIKIFEMIEHKTYKLTASKAVKKVISTVFHPNIKNANNFVMPLTGTTSQIFSFSKKSILAKKVSSEDDARLKKYLLNPNFNRKFIISYFWDPGPPATVPNAKVTLANL